MAPLNLQGLNIIHPHRHSDSQDLLPGPPYPELSAQLDLWTNLTFDSDEGPVGTKNDDDKYENTQAMEDEEEAVNGGEAAIHYGHVNVVTGTNLENNQSRDEHQYQNPPAFDLNAFLTGLGIDPFSAPPVHSQQPSANVPSLAQLLALHSAQAGGPSQSTPSSEKRPAIPDRNPDYSFPPAKRVRTRQSSISTVDSQAEHRDSSPNPTSTPLSVAEDKRRRNTAASARFRLKKKEREAALEGKAKELEGRVTELERECEGLRRENGWLKGLVIGVTGAAQQPAVPAVTSGSKRPRDESDE